MPSGPIPSVIEHLRRLLPPEDAELTDGQLLECFVSHGEPGALEALVRRHGPMVWGVCRRLLGTHHDAEDALQATFLVLVRRAASVSPRSRVGNWLYGVARQTALKARAGRARRRERERPVAVMPEPAVTDPEPQDDLRALLDEEIGRLPGHYRAAVVLCELGGRTVKEAARQLGCPEGTVASRLVRGRALLARRLARHGLAVSGAALLPWPAAAAVPAAVLDATIRAVTAVAAGQAAAGTVTGAVAALTEGVIKAMVLGKSLKVTAALLVLVTLGGAAGILYHTRAAEPPKPRQVSERLQDPKAPGAQPGKPSNDAAGLQGTWHLVRSESDGVTFGEGRPEVKDTFLVFNQSAVTMTGKAILDPAHQREPEEVKAVGTFTLDAKKDPKVIVFAWETNPFLSKEFLTQRGIYRLEGDRLKLCFYFPGGDTKDLLPTEFSAKAGSKRSVSTWERVPPSGKGGEGRPAKDAGEATGTHDKGARQESAKGPGIALGASAKLQGAWQMVAFEADGLTVGEGRPELKSNRLVIGQGSLTLSYTPDFARPRSGTRQAVATYTLDTKQAPAVMVLTWKESPWDGQNDVVHKAVYSLEGDRLKLCLSCKEHDREVPADFSAKAGSGRLLWTFQRVPPDEKAGAKEDSRQGR